MTVIPDPAWETLLQRLIAIRGTVLFLGRSDSGKSTLVKYLLGELTSLGLSVAVVDADIGQSFLGLPGTVSRRTFHAPPTPHELHWEEFSFLGSITPAPILSFLAAETGRMTQRCRQGAAITLVDTTGLVDGELGRALKLAKIQAVAPQIVVAVAAGGELEPILGCIPAEVTFRLASSPLVKRRSPEVRSRHRHARLAAYLHDAREHLLATRRVLFIRHGVPVHPMFAFPAIGTAVGLNHNGITRALGVVSEADADSLVVVTPLSSLSGIDRVILGDFAFSWQ